jgi:outer membrane protein assembly factor BamB
MKYLISVLFSFLLACSPVFAGYTPEDAGAKYEFTVDQEKLCFGLYMNSGGLHIVLIHEVMGNWDVIYGPAFLSQGNYNGFGSAEAYISDFLYTLNLKIDELEDGGIQAGTPEWIQEVKDFINNGLVYADGELIVR